MGIAHKAVSCDKVAWVGLITYVCIFHDCTCDSDNENYNNPSSDKQQTEWQAR